MNTERFDALDLATGKRLWSVTLPTAEGGGTAAGALGADYLFTQDDAGAHSWTLRTVDAATGERLWDMSLDMTGPSSTAPCLLFDTLTVGPRLIVDAGCGFEALTD